MCWRVEWYSVAPYTHCIIIGLIIPSSMQGHDTTRKEGPCSSRVRPHFIDRTLDEQGPTFSLIVPYDLRSESLSRACLGAGGPALTQLSQILSERWR